MHDLSRVGLISPQPAYLAKTIEAPAPAPSFCHEAGRPRHG